MKARLRFGFKMKRLIEAKNDLEMADWLESNLRGCGIDFDENDFPCFRRGFFSEDPPTDIVPFGRRHDFDPMTTALCFYSDDRELYRRIRHLEEDIDAYREFASVMPCDLSVSPLMPIELQRFHLHFNALVNAFLAVNGVKIVAPTRWGSFSNLPLFRCYRESNVFSVGALGTLKNCGAVKRMEADFVTAFCSMYHPQIILSYGKMDIYEKAAWGNGGAKVCEYADYHSRCRSGVNERI